MNWIGPAITKSLTPPPPIEINPPKPVRKIPVGRGRGRSAAQPAKAARALRR